MAQFFFVLEVNRLFKSTVEMKWPKIRHDCQLGVPDSFLCISFLDGNELISCAKVWLVGRS